PKSVFSPLNTVGRWRAVSEASRSYLPSGWRFFLSFAAKCSARCSFARKAYAAARGKLMSFCTSGSTISRSSQSARVWRRPCTGGRVRFCAFDCRFDQGKPARAVAETRVDHPFAAHGAPRLVDHIAKRIEIAFRVASGHACGKAIVGMKTIGILV